MTPSAPEALLLPATVDFPNSALPALIYRSALANRAELAADFEALFAANGWVGAWRNGLYRQHHYHSTAHEVLGVFRGHVELRLGGPTGPSVELRAGDVAIVPAGVAHKNERQSSDFSVVGAYPQGTSADLQYGSPEERARAEPHVASVPVPSRDPVTGGALWR